MNALSKHAAYAHNAHEDEERLSRFAHRCAAWIGEALHRQNVTHASLFASAKLLGALRQVWPAHSRVVVDMQEGEFVPLSSRELAANPRIQKLFEPAASR